MYLLQYKQIITETFVKVNNKIKKLAEKGRTLTTSHGTTMYEQLYNTTKEKSIIALYLIGLILSLCLNDVSNTPQQSE